MLKNIAKYLNRLSFAKASLFYVFANILGQGVVLLSSSVFTRMMSKADYGLVSTYSTWVLILNTFICLNLFISVRTAYIDFREDYDRYCSSVLFLSILSGIVISLIVLAVTQIGRTSIGFFEVLIACIQSVALNVINYMLAVQSMKNEYKQRSLLLIAPNWSHTVLSIVLMLIFTEALYMAKIAGNAAGLMLFGVICTIILFRRAKPLVIPKYWKYAIRISVPTIFHTLSDLILMQCDRLMLTAMVGAETTAEYSIIYNVSSIIVIIYQAINGAWVPWFFEKVKEGQSEQTKKYQEYYMLAFTVFTCGMMAISPELIKILSPKSYWGGISYVYPIIVASYLIFLYTFFSSYLLFRKRTITIAVNTVIVATLNVGLNYILIPEYHAVGAVIATVVSYAVLYLLQLIAVIKDGKHFFSINRMWISFLGIVLLAGVYFLIKDWWIIRYATFMILIVIVFLYKGKDIIMEVIGGK